MPTGTPNTGEVGSAVSSRASVRRGVWPGGAPWLMLELSPEAVGSGVASAAIMTTLCALVGRYALPRWIAAREKHEAESDERMSRLRERIDSVKADGIAAMNAMAERFHARIDSVNGLVGGL